MVASGRRARREVSNWVGPWGARCGDWGGVEALGDPGVGVAVLDKLISVTKIKRHMV